MHAHAPAPAPALSSQIRAAAVPPRRKRARVAAPAPAPRTDSRIHLTSFSARQPLLKPCIALGAQLATLVDKAALTTVLTTPAAAVVHAALGSPSFSAVGARDGLPWSLNSVYAMMAARFLGRSSQLDVVRTTVAMPARDAGGAPDTAMVLTACPDGATLFVATTHKLLLFDVATGALLRVVGDHGAGPLQFHLINDVCFGPDGRVYVTDRGNHRVQVLTDTLEHVGNIGAGKLRWPYACIVDETFVICAGFHKRSAIVVFKFNAQLGTAPAPGRLTLRAMTQKTHFALTDRSTYDPCQALCFVPGGGGNFVAARAWHREVYVYTPRGVLLQMVSLPTASGYPRVTFSPRHELVVTCGRDDTRGAAVVCLDSGVIEGWLDCGIGRHVVFAGADALVLAMDNYWGPTFDIVRSKYT